MQTVMLMRWAGVTPEQYEEARSRVDWEGDVPDGAVLHVAGFDGDDLCVTDVWDSPEQFQRIRNHQANGMGGLPLVGDPDSVARDMTRLAALGLKGIAVSLVNYLDELPYFCAEVLPRLEWLGLREKPTA